MESTEKPKPFKGLIFTFLGMLFTTIGMILIALESPKAIYLTCTIVGALLAIYGLFFILRTVKQGE